MDSFSDNIFITSQIKTEKSPTFHTNIYAWDSINKSPINFNKNNIILNENSINLPINDFINSQYINTNEVEIFISFPQSSLISQNKLFEIKQAIKNVLNKLPNKNIKIGLLGYSNKNFLIKGLTNNFDDISDGLNLIETSGGNNFISGIYQAPFPILDFFTNLENQKYLLFLNIGNSEIDSNLIVQKAIQNKIKILSFDLDSTLNNNILNICTKTNGNYIFSDKINNIENTFFITLLDLIGYKPNHITWTNTSCNLPKVYNFIVNYKNTNYQWTDSNSIKNNTLSLDDIKLIPNNYLNFSNVTLNQKKKLSLILLNNGNNTKVKNIITNTNRINITGIDKNSILSSNNSYPIEIEYSAIDTNYHYSKIFIETDNCQIIEIIITAGNQESNTQQTLKLLKPNENEELITNQNYLIKWDGIDINDSVSIFHSTNNGSTWNNIANNIKGLSYNWTVPDIIGKDNLINVTKYTNTRNLQGVNYINQINPTRINSQLEWNFDGSILASANNDESIILWDPFNIKYLNLVYKESFSKIYDMKWSPVRNFLATSVESNLSGNDILIFDIDESSEIIRLKGNEAKPSSLSWSSNGLFLAAGLQNGFLNLWKVGKDAQPDISFAEHLNEVKHLSFNPVNNWIVSSDNNGVIILRDLDNKVELLRFNSSTAVNGLKWSPDGKYLAISSFNNPNVNCFIIDTNNNKFTLEKFYDIIRQNQSPFNHSINGLDWSKDGSLLVTYAKDYSQVWDANNGKLIYTYRGHNSNINDVSINLQNSFASAGSNNQIQVWDLKSIPHTPKILQSDTSDNKFSINKINLSIKDIDFGEYCVNQLLSINFKNFITNNSKIDIKIDSINFSGENINDFNLIEFDFSILKQNFSKDLRIGFIPSKSGIISAYLNIYVNNLVYTAKLIGKGKSSQLEINTPYLLFDDTPILESTSKMIRITNKNNIPETITNLEFISLNKVFFVNDFKSTEIKSNTFIDIDISFIPINSLYEGGILKIHNLNECTPLEIVLKGRGVIPNLEVKGNNLFEFKSCPPLFIDTILTIYNSGSGNLIIKEVNKLNDSKNEVNIKNNFQLNNLIIKPNEIGKIEFSYESKSNDTTNVTFQIITNLLEGLKNEVIYNLKLYKENYNLELLNIDNKFLNIPVNESLVKTIELKNSGNTEIKFEDEYNFDNFKINKFIIKTIMPNESTTCNLEFIGLPNDTSFIQSMNLNYECNKKLNFDLEISVNSKGSFLTYPTQIKLPEVNCKVENDTTFILKNISNKPLQIKDIYLENLQKTEVYFKENYINLVLQPKEELSINVFYQFNTSFEYLNNLIIETDASNAINNFITIPIEINSKLYGFDILIDTLIYEVITNKENKQEYFEIINTGSKELNWNDFNFVNTYFKLDSIVPYITPVGQTSKFYITYNPIQLEEKISYDLILSDNCSNNDKITLNGNVLGKKYISLKLNKQLAKVGDEINVPIFLNNPNLIDILNTDTIKVLFSFNKTILHPQFNSNWNPKFDSTFIIDNRRYIIKYIEIEDLISTNDKNYRVEFLDFFCALGDTSWTELKLEDAYFINKDIKILIESGSFELSDVCYIEGGRYVKGNGKIVFNNIYPNPTSDFINLSFSLIENGTTAINLYDIRGRLINKLLENQLESGDYNLKFNLDYLENDIYYIELKTPTMRKLNKFIKIN